MLTAKENMRQVILGGNPDRLVNQYEAIQLLFHPFMLSSPLLKRGDENVVNAWGVTNSFPANTPGAFPVHTCPAWDFLSAADASATVHTGFGPVPSTLVR